MIAGRLPRPWQLSALARGSSLLWVRGQPAVGPSSPTAPSSPPTPDNADVVGPPWRGPDHIWLWLSPDNPALSAPRTSPGPAALALSEVMCDTFSTHQNCRLPADLFDTELYKSAQFTVGELLIIFL